MQTEKFELKMVTFEQSLSMVSRNENFKEVLLPVSARVRLPKFNEKVVIIEANGDCSSGMYYKDSEGNIVYSFKNRERWARDYTKTVWLERCIVLDIPKTEDLVNAAILYVESMISRTSEDLCECFEAGYAWGVSRRANAENEIKP